MMILVAIWNSAWSIPAQIVTISTLFEEWCRLAAAYECIDGTNLAPRFARLPVSMLHPASVLVPAPGFLHSYPPFGSPSAGPIGAVVGLTASVHRNRLFVTYTRRLTSISDI
jgi:hypothetical protein